MQEYRPNGVDWQRADWTIAVDSEGEKYLYADFPLNPNNPSEQMATGRMFILPAGKVLKKVDVSCPPGAIVAFSQGKDAGSPVECTGSRNTYETGWAAPPYSDVVYVWMDVSQVPEENRGKGIPEVCIYALVYGD